MNIEKTDLATLSEQEIEAISGAGFFYAVGAFIAQQANINDSINQ